MDPATQSFLVWALSFLPPPWNVYAASAIGCAGILSMVASGISAGVKPPSAEAPNWLRVTYKVVTWPALNLRWAQNAVVPGMPPAVQAAAKEAAKIAASMPEKTVVVGVSPSGATVIATKELP